jgi:hypothetical protein
MPNEEQEQLAEFKRLYWIATHSKDREEVFSAFESILEQALNCDENDLQSVAERDLFVETIVRSSLFNAIFDEDGRPRVGFEKLHINGQPSPSWARVLKASGLAKPTGKRK